MQHSRRLVLLWRSELVPLKVSIRAVAPEAHNGLDAVVQGGHWAWGLAVPWQG